MAKIKISAEYNLEYIAQAAGQQDQNKRFYHKGELHVQGVTQKALNDALSSYDDKENGNVNKEALTALRESESVSTLARKLEELIDHIENDAPLSEPAKEWAQARKAERSKL